MKMATEPIRRATDPACPDCGCEASEVLREFEHWSGATMERRACGNCGHEFTAKANGADNTATPVAIFHAVQAPCPHCEGEGKVQRTAGRVRYCRCSSCGQNFKAVPSK